MAATAFIVVAIAAVTTFNEVRDQKAGWGKFGTIIVVGVVLIVAVVWLAGKSATIIFKREATMALHRFYAGSLKCRAHRLSRIYTTHEMFAAAGVGCVGGSVISIPLLPLAGWVILPTGVLIMPLLVVFFGGHFSDPYQTRKTGKLSLPPIVLETAKPGLPAHCR